MMLRSLLILAVSTLLLVACSPEPEPIQYGADACSFCRMTIADARFGAELVTSTGKVYTFDAIECLAAYIDENAGRDDLTIHSLWVTDYHHPRTLINVDDAFFIHGGSLRSPMAMNVAAFSNEAAAPGRVADSIGGTVLNWNDVREIAASGWTNGHHGEGHGGDGHHANGHPESASATTHGSTPMPHH